MKNKKASSHSHFESNFNRLLKCKRSQNENVINNTLIWALVIAILVIASIGMYLLFKKLGVN